MSEQARGWLKSQLNLGTVIHLLIAACTCVGTIFTLRGDVSELKQRVTIVENIVRRLPTDYVPRIEHQTRDEVEKEKEQLLNERLSHMERQLDELLITNHSK